MLLDSLMPFGNRTTPTRRRAFRPISLTRSPQRISNSATDDDGMEFIAKGTIAVVLIGIAPLIAMLLISIFYPDLLHISITPK